MLFNTIAVVAVLLAAKTTAISNDPQDFISMTNRVVDRAAAMLVAPLPPVHDKASNVAVAEAWTPDFLANADPIVRKVTAMDFTSISPETAKRMLTQVDGLGFGCIFNCGAVAAAVPCILAALASTTVTGGLSAAVIAGCATGGAAQICPCADCVGLKGQLENIHFC